MERPAFPLTVFYDGACSVCAAEMASYRRRDRHGRLRLVDISSGEFDPEAFGKTRAEFKRRLQVRDAEGRFYAGVDGFAAIWLAVPGRCFTLLARLVMIPGVHGLARLGYAIFARFRSHLPGSRSCREETCPPRRSD